MIVCLQLKIQLVPNCYSDAAVKLQRDWMQDPQSLHFAQHIKTHALVVLVQKGLRYHEIEQTLKQNGNELLTNAFFGPDPGRDTSSPRNDVSQDDSVGKSRISPRDRKHGRETIANGLSLDFPTPAPAAKRSRRSNGSSNEVAVNGDARGSDSMDLDQNGFSQHEPPEPRSPVHSPADEGQTAAEGAGMDVDDDAPTPDDPRMNLTNGPSVGVQSDKVVELGPETSVLCVPQKIVMHTAWNPTDPQLLATAGDALCRIWTLSHSPSPNQNHHQQHDQYVDILEPSDSSLVTAMAWSPSGDVLAVATQTEDSDRVKQVSLWSKSGNSIDSLLAGQDMVVMFKWNPVGTHLLGIMSPGTNASSLVIWDIRSSLSLPALQLDYVVTDAAWCDDQRFMICGQGLVADCLLDGRNNLSIRERPEADLKQNWSYVRFDHVSGTTALASEESAALAIIDLRGNLFSIIAHDAEITALAYQPVLPSAAGPPNSPRLLATSSLDGNIRIWDANKPFEMIHVLSLGRSTPPMTISFTPDGYLVAAANSSRVLIWNAETGGMPKASWKGEMSKWQNVSNGIDHDSGIGVEDEASTHSLSWDADGAKLAYGLGSQVSPLYRDETETFLAWLIGRSDCSNQFQT
ncbi:MAG: hypothetical protein LQ351_001825 [Letrouitia transgressa]|nr:MAG: hypothetical protein LQ351_001825 [Letrouitia transgressa]